MKNRREGYKFNGKIKLKHIEIMSFFFALLSLLKCWMFARQSGTELTKFICEIIVNFSLVVSIAYIFAIYKIDLKKIRYAIFPMIYILVNIFYRYDGNANISDSGITVVMIATLYLLLPQQCQINIYKIFKYILVVFSLLGIIFYVSYIFHLSIPFTIVPYYEKITQANAIYVNYFNIVLFVSPSGMVRLCGPFNEPGLMGTFLGLMLVAEDLNLKKKGNLILLIAGILTYSMAFVITVIIFCIYKYISDWKILLAIGIFTIVIVIIPYVEFQNKAFQNLITRLFKMENNRTTKYFDLKFENFVRSNRLWIGLGSDIQIAGVLSIKLFVMQYGVVGVLFYVLYILDMGLSFAKKNSKGIVLLMLFLLNMYQRPEVISPGYFIILVGGLQMLNYKNSPFSELRTR